MRRLAPLIGSSSTSFMSSASRRRARVRRSGTRSAIWCRPPKPPLNFASGPPSGTTNSIGDAPAAYVGWMKAAVAAECPSLPWTVLAGIDPLTDALVAP